MRQRSNPTTDLDQPQHWLQLSFTSKQPAQLEDLLLEMGAQAVTLRDAADQPLLEPLPGETPLWDAVRITGLFTGDTPAEPILAALAAHLDTSTLATAETELLEDRAWVRAWMAHFRPIQCGEHLWVCPSHHEVDIADAVVVKLDPGLAFGTGTHPTTALCLRWLDQASSLEPFKGKTVIDYGCGSGILAVAAALLGAAEIWAVDIDPQALEATRSNAQINGVSSLIKTCLPDALPNDITAELIVANILAGPLVNLAPELALRLRNNGQLVLAGLLCSQSEEIVNAYRQHIALQTIFEHDDWRLLAGRKSQ